MSELSLQGFRLCRKCGCTKPLTADFFLRDSKENKSPNTSGFRYGCKVCFLAYQAEYRRKNRERLLARERELNSTVEAKAKARQYVENNREIYREACRKWREKNPGKQHESTQRYLKANPHKKREFDRTYRARKFGAEHEPYSAADINDMWHKQDGCCYYCDVPVFATYHIDHKQPLSRGGADKLENLCIACQFCNNSKKDKTEEEFADYRSGPTSR